jgi:hypothetical protein
LPEPFVERSQHQQQTFNSFEELAKNEGSFFSLSNWRRQKNLYTDEQKREGTISTMTARDLEQSSNKS